jgi:hypothetical protein
MENHTFKEVLVFRVAREDRRALQKAALHLDLKESEIGRRALRLGLQALEGSELPGAKIKKESGHAPGS